MADIDNTDSKIDGEMANGMFQRLFSEKDNRNSESVTGSCTHRLSEKAAFDRLGHSGRLKKIETK